MRLLIAAALAIACSGVWAQEYRTTGRLYLTGTTLEKYCAPSNYTDDMCYMAVVGMSDALMYWGATSLTGGYCIPDGVNSTQLPKVYARWIKQNPEIEHQPAVHLVRNALQEAYPCDD